jgi:hypothetical protein
MRLSYLRRLPRSMKSQVDLVISQISAAPSAPSCARQEVADHLSQIRLRGLVDCEDTLYQKWKERQRGVEGYCISKLSFCTLRIKNRKAGLNDPIWGGARYNLGSPGLSALAPLPLTDYKHEMVVKRVCTSRLDSHRSSPSDN